jgi:hypothetical protein
MWTDHGCVGRRLTGMADCAAAIGVSANRESLNAVRRATPTERAPQARLWMKRRVPAMTPATNQGDQDDDVNRTNSRVQGDITPE